MSQISTSCPFRQWDHLDHLCIETRGIGPLLKDDPLTFNSGIRY
jgi:hypothetical protein